MANDLEAHVRMAARALHANQKARLYKIPNDMRIVEGSLIHGGQTPADFMGFTITGRVIVLECKMRKQKSLELGPKGLKAHQQIAISEAHRAGGIGLLAWLNVDMVAVIDAGMVKAFSTQKGRKSIRWDDIPGKFLHELDEDPTHLFWPFL